MPAAAVALCLRSVLRARSAALPLLRGFSRWRGAPLFLCFIPCRGQLSAVMPLPLHMRLTPVACSAPGQTASTPAGRSGSGRLLNPDDFDEDDRSDEESRPPTPDSIAELLPELHEYRSYLAWLTHRRVIVYKYVAARRRLARLGLVRSPFDLYATVCTFPHSPVPAPRCPA